jgi:MFS family permease
LRGRVMSLYMVLFRGTPALGALFFGMLAEFVGLRMSFALAALLCLAIALALLPRRHAISAGLSSGSATGETQTI